MYLSLSRLIKIRTDSYYYQEYLISKKEEDIDFK